jgi:hypothetical protein
MAAIRFKVKEEDGQEFVEEIHKVVVHQFYMGDVEDPDLWAGQSLYEWQISEPGKFIMENSLDKPMWNRQLDYATYGHRYVITAELESKKLSEFYLRWGNPNGSDKSR